MTDSIIKFVEFKHFRSINLHRTQNTYHTISMLAILQIVKALKNGILHVYCCTIAWFGWIAKSYINIFIKKSWFYFGKKVCSECAAAYEMIMKMKMPKISFLLWLWINLCCCFFFSVRKLAVFQHVYGLLHSKWSECVRDGNSVRKK